MLTLAPDAPELGHRRRARRQLQGQLDRVRRFRARGRAPLLGRRSAASPPSSTGRSGTSRTTSSSSSPRSQSPRIYRRLVAARRAGAARDRRRGAQDLRRRAGAGRHGHEGDRPAAASSSSGCASTSASSGCAASRRQGRLQRLQEGEGERLRPPPLRADDARARRAGTSSTCSAIRRLAAGARQGGARRAHHARPADLQHRVRLPDEPARPVRLHLASAPGASSSTRWRSTPTGTRA